MTTYSLGEVNNGNVNNGNVNNGNLNNDNLNNDNLNDRYGHLGRSWAYAVSPSSSSSSPHGGGERHS